jgi:hypothetical protein
MVSDLLYGGGKTLEEIAGYTVYQMRWVICRERDKAGRLVRNPEGLPWWVKTDENGMRIIGDPQPFNKALHKAWKGKLRDDQFNEKWEQFLKANPGYGQVPGRKPGRRKGIRP